MRGLLLFTLTGLLITACSKSKSREESNVYDQPLTGQWLATEYFMSPGSGGSWYALPESGKFTVSFLSDSSFQYSGNFPLRDSLFDRYSARDSRLLMRSARSTAQATWYYDVDSLGRLQLAFLLCIEGCPYRLQRIK